MLDKLYGLLARFGPAAGGDSRRASDFLLTLAMSIFMGMMYLLCAVLYVLFSCPHMAAACLLNALACIAAICLLPRGLAEHAHVLLTLNLFLYILASVVFIGGRGFVVLYCFLGLLLQLALPYRRQGLPVLWGCLMIAAAALIYLSGGESPGLTPLSPAHLASAGPAHFLIVAFSSCVLLVLKRSAPALLKRLHGQDREAPPAQSMHDALTGLYSRRQADAFFAGLGEGEGPVCLALADVDDFKAVNSRWGSAAGDEALQAIAATLQGSIRKTDGIFRWDGDEFLLVIQAEEENAYWLLEKIRATVAETPVPTSRGPLTLTLTLGMCAASRKRIGMGLSLCGQKLYEGKRRGKNQVVR